MSQVIVTTGSRLHFGLLAHAPGGARRFGGVGLMVSAPGFQVVASNDELLPAWANGPSIQTTALDEYFGPLEWSSRVLNVAQRCRETSVRSQSETEVRIRWMLNSTIPSHVGLGSGTQLALAVARAWMTLRDDAEPDPTRFAIRAGRGLRSALGIHGFHQGGLLVEAGKRTEDQISPVVARAEFPAEWPILLIRPLEERGLSGNAEIAAFAALPPMSDATSAALCRTVLLELLPAVHEGDFAACAEALFQFGWLIGEYFAPAQGGVFASQRMASLVDWLRQRGIAGVGQSSWGPMLFAMCPDTATAESLRQDLGNSNWGDCEILMVTAMNTGAKVCRTP